MDEAMAPTPLLIATNNPGKVAEIRALLSGLGIQLLVPIDRGLSLDVVEDGLSYAENAAKKALAFSSASRLVSLADDSGLEVDALSGSCMMVRREVVEQVGLLDEDIFMFGEDIDWCWRIKQAGWKVYYVPESSVYHYHGASSRLRPVTT